jgi:hypothetical protein
VFGHEVNVLRPYFFGRHTEITFIFPIFIINEDDHPPPMNFLYGFLRAKVWHFTLISKLVFCRLVALQIFFERNF